MHMSVDIECSETSNKSNTYKTVADWVKLWTLFDFNVVEWPPPLPPPQAQ